jgi:hypothetical protein
MTEWINASASPATDTTKPPPVAPPAAESIDGCERTETQVSGEVREKPWKRSGSAEVAVVAVVACPAGGGHGGHRGGGGSDGSGTYVIGTTQGTWHAHVCP